MSNSKRFNRAPILLHQPGRVFETDDFGQHWTRSATQGLCVPGGPVNDPGNQALVEFSFVLPELSAENPGCYPIFKWARDSEEEPGDVLLSVTYEPSKGLFHCGMNAGMPNRLSLGPAPPERYTQRVLRAFILIAPGRLYPSIEDPSNEQDELFGEFQLARTSASSPWGTFADGSWSVTSGCRIQQDQDEKSFPPGFGLSDVRVHLLDSSGEDFSMLPYSGGLDHLIAPYASPNWDGEADEDSLAQLIQGFADEFVELAGEANTWASRLLKLANDTERLALDQLGD